MAISSVKLWIKVTAVASGGCTVKLHWSQSANNWGAVLEANDADFVSTDDTYETSVSITATGWFSFSINPASLNMSSTLYVRLMSADEGAADIGNITFASQNNATAGDRPYLEIIEAAAGGPPLRTLMGVGK